MVSDRPHRSLRRGPDTDSRHIRRSRAQPLDLGFGVAYAYADEDHRPLLADDRLVSLLNQD